MSPEPTIREQFRQRRERIADALRDPKRTYEEIGAEFSITRERVRQIAVKYGLTRRAKPVPTTANGGPQ